MPGITSWLIGMGLAIPITLVLRRVWKVLNDVYQARQRIQRKDGELFLEVYDLRKKVRQLEADLRTACQGDPELADKAKMARKIRKLKNELTMAYANNHERNLELDAMHHIWCTGCDGGAHHWTTEKITQEHMDIAREGIKRLEVWWKHHLFRKHMSHGDMHRYWQLNQKDREEVFKELEKQESAQASNPGT